MATPMSTPRGRVDIDKPDNYSDVTGSIPLAAEEPNVVCPLYSNSASSSLTKLGVSIASEDDRPTSGHVKTPKGIRAINTPVAPVHVDRRFFPRDMRGLLEIYEQGHTLQQGMRSTCEESCEALSSLSNRCESSVNDLMSQMDLILTKIKEQADRPANVDWTCVLEALAKIDRLQPSAIGEDVEQRLRSHVEAMVEIENRIEDKMAAKIHCMDDSMDKREECQRQELERLRAEVKAAQDLAAQLGESMKQTETELKDAFSNQHRALKTDFAQTLQDVLRLQEKNRRADMARVEPLLEEQLARVLGNHQEALKANVSKGMDDIRDMQEAQSTQICNFEPLLKTQFSIQLDKQRSLSEVPNRELKEIHTIVSEDMGCIFKEIATIQKALNLEYKVKPRHENLMLEGSTCRDFGAQTESPSLKDTYTQIDEIFLKNIRRKEKQGRLMVSKPKAQVAERQQLNRAKSGYHAHEKKKAKLRQALIKPTYNVANYYHTTGCAQKIARSQKFENLTFFFILLNAIWIAVDTDHNDAVVLIYADPVFQVVENIFCTYFTGELLVRFLAFKQKQNCARDTWFVFDSILVLGMVVETWFITVVLLFITGGSGSSAGISNFSILRMARLVKILRMARMARLLRMVPELVVILKSIGAAFRSVSFFLLLTVIILYVYAVGFRQLTKDSAIGKQYFSTVPRAMNNLLLDGMLPLYSKIVTDVSSESPLYWPLIMTFILLASVTVMNMLVGVLVEVVRTVADREREAMTVIHVTNELRDGMQHFLEKEGLKAKGITKDRSSFAASFAANRQDSGHIPHGKLDIEHIPDMTKQTFETFLGTSGCVSALRDCGVDAIALLDSTDLIFEEKVKPGARGLRFVDFVEVVLNMRGTNPATVKDVKEQMRLVKTAAQDASSKTNRLFSDQLSKTRNELVMMLHDLRRLVDSDAGSEDGGSMVMSFAQSMREHMTNQTTASQDDGDDDEEEEDEWVTGFAESEGSDWAPDDGHVSVSNRPSVRTAGTEGGESNPEGDESGKDDDDISDVLIAR